VKPPSHRRRPEPYYKVQFRDEITLSWKDRRKEAFATLEEAKAFAAGQEGQIRVVSFKGGRSEVADV
jgi:hypothetical protein